jgi:hypothetical protein
MEKRPIILGIARGYSVGALSPFVLSLRRAGYRGDICFFVDQLAPPTLAFLAEHGVQFQPLPARYFTQWRRHPLRLLADLVPGAVHPSARIALSKYYLHLLDARHPCYLDFLEKTRGAYSHVMFTDVKDVIFQQDPFDFDWPDAFCSFTEAVCIRDEPHTRGWIEKGFGAAAARDLGDRPVICAGVSFATIGPALEYLRRMSENLVRIDSRGLVDQGVHNYLLHRGLVSGARIYDLEESPVLHLGVVPPEKLRLNGEGLVVNGSGRPAHAVHQYFPHRKALARFLEGVTAPDSAGDDGILK